jgi:hypothetical protein
LAPVLSTLKVPMTDAPGARRPLKVVCTRVPVWAVPVVT